MAANVRAKTTGWSANEILTATQANAMDTNGATAVNRNSTAGGAKRMPVCYIGSSTAGVVTIVASNPTFDTAADYYSWFALTGLPRGHVLTAVSAIMLPLAGHAGQPGQMPTLSLYRTGSSGVPTQIGSTGTHTWVDIATYDAGFTLSCSALAHTVNPTDYDYRLAIRHESGANAQLISVCSILATMTIDAALGGVDLSFWL